MTRRFVVGLLAVLILTGGCGSSGPAVVRVVSYNIHHGEGLDERVDLERIAALILEADADLVALQEVDRGTARTDRRDMPARLAEMTGMEAIFEKNIDFQGGEYGNAVLTRWPVDRWRNHLLPQLRVGEQRGMLEVALRVKGHRLIFLATHFDYRSDHTERMASVETCRTLVEGHADTAIILAGDLNARSDGPVMQKLFGFMRDACPVAGGPFDTFPANAPNRRIDYILFRGASGLSVRDFGVIDERVASDHRPIRATFVVEE